MGKRAKPAAGLFWDLEVEDAHEFLTLTGGIVHNSQTQASRAHKYFVRLLERREVFKDSLIDQPTRDKVEFRNGSFFTILTSSTRSARGPHAHRIICDEVEEMSPDVWESIKLAVDMHEESIVTFEVLSTRHRVGGVMTTYLSQLAQSPHARVFRWCLRETIAPCPKDALCSNCDLSLECGGVAKFKRDGFLKREKLVQAKHRMSEQRWLIEMLLALPRPSEVLLPEFQDAHPFVQAFGTFATLPFIRGLDFGKNDPSVCIWAQYDKEADRLWVVDELVVQNVSIRQFAQLIHSREASRGYVNVVETWGDPHGGQALLGMSEEGIFVLTDARPRKSERVELLRYYLRLRNGVPGIVIHRRCQTLRQQLASLSPSALHLRSKERDDAFDALLYLISGVARKSSTKDLLKNVPGATVRLQEEDDGRRVVIPGLRSALGKILGHLDKGSRLPYFDRRLRR